jgi:hypothetical protein
MFRVVHNLHRLYGEWIELIIPASPYNETDSILPLDSLVSFPLLPMDIHVPSPLLKVAVSGSARLSHLAMGLTIQAETNEPSTAGLHRE